MEGLIGGWSSHLMFRGDAPRAAMRPLDHEVVKLVDMPGDEIRWESVAVVPADCRTVRLEVGPLWNTWLFAWDGQSRDLDGTRIFWRQE